MITARGHRSRCTDPLQYAGRHAAGREQLSPERGQPFPRGSTILFRDHREGVDQKCDGWGQLIRYRLQGTGYELRSPGADGQIGTGDDMVATAQRLPDRPDGAP